MALPPAEVCVQNSATKQRLQNRDACVVPFATLDPKP